MFDKPTATPTLGLEIDSSVLRGAYLGLHQGRPTLLDLFHVAIDQEENTPLNVKLLYKEGEEAKLHEAIDKSLVVTALSTSEVLVRNLDIQLTKDKDIDAVLEFQVEPLLPYTIEEGVIDRIILDKSKESTRLTVLAARTNQLSLHLEQWNTLGIEPEVVGCVPASLAAFSGFFSPAEGVHFHLHLGLSETTCIIVNEGKLLAAQASRICINTLIEAYTKDKNGDREEAEESFYKLDFSSEKESSSPELFKTTNQLRLEVTKFLYALAKHSSGLEVSEILVTGEGCLLSNFPETLCGHLRKTLLFPTEQPGFSNIELVQQNAIPIGMALTALPTSKGPVNFRQKDYLYPHPWKRIQKPMTVYLTLCALLAFSLYIFGPAYIANKETILKKEFVDLLASMKKPFHEFEQEFRSAKEKKEVFVTEEEVDITAFSQRDIESRLNYLEKEIRGTPNIFPLYPKSPRVSDVLAWLSNHPHVVGEDKEKTMARPRIQLKSFSYKMVKRPEGNKEREKYQVKVEVEFTTPTPRYAREFHDILLAPNDIVDPKEEVKWNVEKESYRTSFFLQDKTNYTTSRRRS